MAPRRNREPGEAEREVEERRPRFYTYLMGLGPTDQARADVLGLRREIAMDYRMGNAMPRFSIVTDPNISAEQRARRAELVRCLAEDMAAAYPAPPCRAAA